MHRETKWFYDRMKEKSERGIERNKREWMKKGQEKEEWSKEQKTNQGERMEKKTKQNCSLELILNLGWFKKDILMTI